MIQVKIKQVSGLQTIKISGHAEAGPYGHDLVCAAVSALSAQLSASLSDAYITDDGMTVFFKLNSFDAGDVRIVLGFKEVIKQMVSQYPDNIRLIASDEDGRQR